MAALVERTAPYPDVARPGRFRALVVMSDPHGRDALARTLRALGAYDVVEAASIGEARVRARASSPRELTVTEAALPDGSGLALLAELRGVGWVRGVALSRQHDPYTVRAALAAGVRSFLVARTAEGAAAPGTPARSRGGVGGLSARELEVLRLVAEGRSNRDIGEVLGLSALTVKSHLARIARKVGTGDRAEMVAIALRAGVID